MGKNYERIFGKWRIDQGSKAPENIAKQESEIEKKEKNQQPCERKLKKDHFIVSFFSYEVSILNLIGNKEKRFAGGNWGHPRKWLKRHTKIQDPPEVPRHHKRKKKKKKPWVNDRGVCPFCKKELQIIGEIIGIFAPRENNCKYCGAEVVECPSCRRGTWKSKDGIYKHQTRVFSCGFVGQKKGEK